MTIEAMKQALEALDNLARYADTCELFLKETHPGKADALRERVTISIKVITSLRQAIEQAEKQEPVAFASHGVINWIADKQFQHEADLYTAPQPQPQREWVGLTDEEMKAVCVQTWSYDPYIISRAIEAKLKEKNT